MNKKLSQFFKHPLVVIVAGGVILSTITSFIPQGWAFVGSIISSVWSFLISLITIPVWLFCILVILSIFFFLVIFMIIKYTRKTLTEQDKEHIGEDGMKWKYRIGSYGPSLYGPFCPKCDLELVKHSRSHRVKGLVEYYICEDCMNVIFPFKKNQMGKEQRRIARDIRKTKAQNQNE
ncbi:MAG: ABC transporter ATP-binding protein [Candidatus Aegiribacteria sp.]|nr:ABC transporter ATP-binding protein [Candidatus Aegiribacteria sp.]